MFIVTQPYSDALGQAKRLFAELLIILASKDNSEELLGTKAAVLDAIKTSNAKNKQELGSHIRSRIIFMANHVYEKNGINELFVAGLISEAKKRGTLYGLIDLVP
jgi:hypothetical protein